MFIESNEYAEMFLRKIDKDYWHGNYIWFNQDGEYTGWDRNLDWYPRIDDNWNTIGTFYIPERKVAKLYEVFL